jgi:hypothetical protein
MMRMRSIKVSAIGLSVRFFNVTISIGCDFIEEAKASGFVQKAIDRVGPRGSTVAPPGNSN